VGPARVSLAAWRQDGVEFDGGRGRGEAGVAGRTVDDWQMPKASKPGDPVIWYAAGRREYIARGWVDAIPTG